ncbi:MAG: hypothetical protein JRG84_05535 [Deltaproteobacteria bacterium]|nr:hypothetical protein [Deltaproteobacteria bacterium]
MHCPFARLVTVWILLGCVTVGCHQLDFGPRVAEGEIDIYDDLFSVSASDESHTVAVGYHGAAYWTHDGGATWSKGDTGTKMLLYSVSMADSQNGWAVGQLGTILRTSDGGETWQDQPNLKRDEGAHLFGVHAIDASRAWAVGEWGTRIFTEDGGATWQDRSVLVTLDHPMFVWLSATDQERVREGKKVYEDVGLNDVFCLAPPKRNCWIIGEFGYIFRSEDLGQTWERGEVVGDVFMNPITLPYNVINFDAEAKAELAEFAAQIEDETHLNVLIDVFVSGKELANLGDEEDPYALFDLISARIDETKSVLEEAGILQDRMRMPNKPPWDFEDFVEHDPTFLRRYFDGRVAAEPIIKVAVIQNPYLFTVNFQDESEGFISGLGGVVLRSSDGGKGWRYVTIDLKQALFSVASGASRAVALGEKGLVRLSPDIGKTWKAPEPGDFPTVFTFMRDVHFERGRKVGYIVGQQGMILRSENGGKSWRQILPPGDLGVGRVL